jgi:hypothetical protein
MCPQGKHSPVNNIIYHGLWSETRGQCGRKLIISFSADAGNNFKSVETAHVIFSDDVSLTKAICRRVTMYSVRSMIFLETFPPHKRSWEP